jgi:hypothetical protein
MVSTHSPIAFATFSGAPELPRGSRPVICDESSPSMSQVRLVHWPMFLCPTNTNPRARRIYCHIHHTHMQSTCEHAITSQPSQTTFTCTWPICLPHAAQISCTRADRGFINGQIHGIAPGTISDPELLRILEIVISVVCHKAFHHYHFHDPQWQPEECSVDVTGARSNEQNVAQLL